MKRNSRGFSFIELLVAATIIAVLSAIGFVSYASANRNARNGKRKADLEQVRAALELYRSDSSSYPDRNGDWAGMMTDISSYVTSPNVNDPKSGAGYAYSYETTDNGRTYTVCATTEPNVVGTNDYCLNNP